MTDQQPAKAGRPSSPPHQEGSPEMRLQALPSAAGSSMLQGHNSVLQALLGTFFTWGLTAAGAALVFIFSSGQRRILDGSLGFAAGVMLAASYWSLLAPAVEMATSSGGFGAFAFFPVAIGFTLGAAFVYLADLLMPHLVRTHGDTRTQSMNKKPDPDSSSALMWDFPASRTGAAEDPPTALALNFAPALMKKSDAEGPRLLFPESELSIRIGRAGLLSDKSENGEAYQRKKAVAAGLPEGPAVPPPPRGNLAQPLGGSWRRIALLILAITIHNIPEGLAVGVGFGAVEKTASATFESARMVAAGQDVEEAPTARLADGCSQCCVMVRTLAGQPHL
ncbi:zinc transporter ZIP11 isoform X7 [Panthera pardus]|uniref:Zinc transporter ZIP11 n=2 Tax=Pantherinae TaxID=338153 RepID=A0A9W2USK8_PANPR|nr:zinc transporter ZIP11 isoform X7 [Panthera pardus]